MRTPRTVAVTGMGVISPYGVGWKPLLDGISQGRSAIAPLRRFANPLDLMPVVGEVMVPLSVDAPPGSVLSRTDKLAVLAGADAVSGVSSEHRRECAVVIGSTVAGLADIDPAAAVEPAQYFRRGGLGPASTFAVSHVADTVARILALGGPRLGVSVACATGAMAIALAAGWIREGRTLMAVAGGSDALCAFTLGGFNALQALDWEPCRPFCYTRSGLNLGEAAAMLLLEDSDSAIARGAHIIALLDGWASTNDAFHSTAPHEEGLGLAASIRLALRRAVMDPDEVGYVNAHGTGTRLNDIAEAKAYDKAFEGSRTRIPVSSTKSYTGHTLGAAGALEAAISVLALRSGRLFPTLRLEQPIETASMDLVRGACRTSAMRGAMSVSAGFGGSNTSLVFRIPDGDTGKLV